MGSHNAREAHVTRESAKKGGGGGGWGTHPVPHFFPRCLKETGTTATQVTPVYSYLRVKDKSRDVLFRHSW